MAERKEPYVEKKVGECIQWKVTGQCSERNSCIFSHDPALGDRCEAQRQKGSIPLQHLIRSRTDGEKVPGKRERSSSHVRRRIPCRDRSIVQTRRVRIGILPCVRIASPIHDAYMDKDVTFNMLRQRRIPTTSRRKRWC